MRKIKDIFN